MTPRIFFFPVVNRYFQLFSFYCPVHLLLLLSLTYSWIRMISGTPSLGGFTEIMLSFQILLKFQELH